MTLQVDTFAGFRWSQDMDVFRHGLEWSPEGDGCLWSDDEEKGRRLQRLSQSFVVVERTAVVCPWDWHDGWLEVLGFPWVPGSRCSMECLQDGLQFGPWLEDPIGETGRY